MRLQEKLDFSFSFEDFNLVYNLAIDYVNDRIDMYNEFLLDDSYDPEITTKYIDFFITPLYDDSIQHPNLYRILHFLQRDYEFFTLPKVYETKEELLHLLLIEPDDIESMESFLDYEADLLNHIVELWNKLFDLVEEYPILTLNDFSHDKVAGCDIHFYPETDPFIKEKFFYFINHIAELFPNELNRLDTWIICSPEYIEFSAGKGTFAFYMNDTVFVRSAVEEKDKAFYIETLYHVFAHYLFELLPERIQEIWYNQYDIWVRNKLEMTREGDKNEVEELFADVVSILCTNTHDYLHEPSSIIVDYVKIIMKDYFNIIF